MAVVKSSPKRRISSNRQELRLSVSGYKAVRSRQELRIAPLTIISGVNSSGKSSFMQPFLLMKQTLESTFDPGPLLLHGSNVKITDFTQIFSRGKSRADVESQISVGFHSGDSSREVSFGVGRHGLQIESDESVAGDERMRLSDPLSAGLRRELKAAGDERAKQYAEFFTERKAGSKVDWQPRVSRVRCFLQAEMNLSVDDENYVLPLRGVEADDSWIRLLREIIHVPGLRGNPERSYPRSAVGATYPGTFDTYVASIIFEWGERNAAMLQGLAHDLESLGLTWKVVARRVDDASVELLVGRMPRAQQGGAQDLVSVADVGFGVSQTLPVLVALRAARAGQLVYIEQPEIHLHPRAQLALAGSLVDAAKRGVRVVAETHSSLLIRGIQIAIASDRISADDVSLNWFSRSDIDGSQQISVADLDSEGRFGDWPIDFDDVAQGADWAYLDAVADPS